MATVLGGIVTLIVSILLAVIVIHLGFVLFQHLTVRINEAEELKQNNVAVAILSGGYILSLGLIVKSSLAPVLQTFFLMTYGDQFSAGEILIHAGFMVLQVLAALLIAVLALMAGLAIFSRLANHMDELAEIKNNNVAVAIVLAVILVTFALFIEAGVASMLQAIVPAPPIQSESLRLPG
ncbi:MAG: DUF350 domain-containing protein [bacterium]|nr:DUF350 domain-containing protein [bacterium]